MDFYLCLMLVSSFCLVQGQKGFLFDDFGDENMRFLQRHVRAAEKSKGGSEDPECALPEKGSAVMKQPPPPECCKNLTCVSKLMANPLVMDGCKAKVLQKKPSEQTTESGSAGKSHSHGPGGGHGHVGKGNACLAECIFNETGLLTSDSKLNEAKVSQKITDLFKDTKYSSLTPKMLQKCLQSAKNVPNGKCKSGAMEFSSCINRELYLNCPAGSWNNAAECQKIKEKLTKCPNLPVPMTPHPAH